MNAMHKTSRLTILAVFAVLVPLSGLAAQNPAAPGITMRDECTLGINARRHWGCSCFWEPIEICPPKGAGLFDKTEWNPNARGGPRAGVTLQWHAIVGTFSIRTPFAKKMPIPIPLIDTGHVANITNYLEVPEDGKCTAGACTTAKRCSYEVSYTLDATNAETVGPVDFKVKQGGAWDTIDRAAAQVIVNIRFCLQPKCGGSKGNTVLVDTSAFSTARVFQEVSIRCSVCRGDK